MGNGELVTGLMFVLCVFGLFVYSIHDTAYGNQIENPGGELYGEKLYPPGWYPFSRIGGDWKSAVVNDSYQGRTALAVCLKQITSAWTRDGTGSMIGLASNSSFGMGWPKDGAGTVGWEAKTRGFVLNTGELYVLKVYYKADVESALYAVSERYNQTTGLYERTSVLLGVAPPAANWTLYVSPVFLGIENCVSVRQVIREPGNLTTDAWDLRRI